MPKYFSRPGVQNPGWLPIHNKIVACYIRVILLRSFVEYMPSWMRQVQQCQGHHSTFSRMRFILIGRPVQLLAYKRDVHNEPGNGVDGLLAKSHA